MDFSKLKAQKLTERKLKNIVNPFVRKHKELRISGFYIKKEKKEKRPFAGIMNSPIGVQGVGETTGEALKGRNVIKYYDLKRKGWRSFRVDLLQFIILEDKDPGIVYYMQGAKKPTQMILKKVLGRDLKKIKETFPSYKIQKIVETSTRKTVRRNLNKELEKWKLKDLVRVYQMTFDGKPPKIKNKKHIIRMLVDSAILRISK